MTDIDFSYEHKHKIQETLYPFRSSIFNQKSSVLYFNSHSQNSGELFSFTHATLNFLLIILQTWFIFG